MSTIARTDPAQRQAWTRWTSWISLDNHKSGSCLSSTTSCPLEEPSPFPTPRRAELKSDVVADDQDPATYACMRT